MSDLLKQIKNLNNSPVESFDATEMTAEEVLAQIENSMRNMDENTMRRVVFTNSDQSFDDVISKK